MFNPLYKISHPNQKDVSSCFGPEFSHSSLKGEFCFYFDEQYREPEGLTYWDLDKERRAYEVNDKKIGGQLHAITIDMWGSHKYNDDDFFFHHFRRNFNSKFYQVQFKTGSESGSGTDSNIYITLFGTQGNSREYEVDAPSHDDFERGNLDTFMVEIFEDIGPIKSIVIRSDGKKKNASWLLDYVTVKNMETHGFYKFQCKTWFEGEKLSHKFEVEKE